MCAGVTHVFFIVQVYSSTIVGWRVAGHMRTEMVFDIIQTARLSHGTRIEGLRW